MKVKVIKRFADKETKAIQEVGKVIEVTKDRYKEIQKYVEEIKEDKKKQ